MSEILGSGLAFPLQVDARGALSLAGGEDDIEQAIELILGTAPGEREMRPEFGCAVHDLVFDTIDAAMIGKLETAIRGALDRWEPRIEVEDLAVRPRASVEDGRLLITITYRVRATNHQRNLVYPFYVIPEEESRVRLPPIELDDRRFQDLVSEARMRIHRACPEWTEHNVSDPGITLIELFAWMTEMTIYRLNRVPDKLHVALMELLGIRLDGPTGALARACASGSARRPTADRRSPAATTEVGTLRGPRPRSRSSSRSTRTSRSRAAAARGLRRPARRQVHRHRRRRRRRREPQGADQLPFGGPPLVGDALYLGFEEPTRRS